MGKPPDFVLEVASESTAQQAMIAKRQIYAQIGIPEYWRFDPTGGDFYGQPLAGDRLVNHTYEPMELTAEPDGILKGYSPALRLSLCGLDGMLKFYNHETDSYLRNLVQTQDAPNPGRSEGTPTQPGAGTSSVRKLTSSDPKRGRVGRLRRG